MKEEYLHWVFVELRNYELGKNLITNHYTFRKDDETLEKQERKFSELHYFVSSRSFENFGSEKRMHI